MEEALKKRMKLALIVLILIFFAVGMVKSCRDVSQCKVSSDKELAIRMDCEEKFTQLSKEKDALEAQLKAVTEELEKIKPDLETTKNKLSQEELVSKSLQEEVDKLIKLKETLEEDLKEASSSTNTKK